VLGRSARSHRTAAPADVAAVTTSTVTFGLAPAGAAEIQETITDLTVSHTDATIGDSVRITDGWSIPDDAQPGDTFSVQLPPELTPVQTEFDLLDGETVVGSATVQGGIVTVALGDYVAEQPLDVHGTFTFNADGSPTVDNQWSISSTGGTVGATERTDLVSASGTGEGTGDASIGDRVWFDTDGNGLQGSGEAGVPGVTAILRDAAGLEVARTVTDAQGYYLFPRLTPDAAHSVQFTGPPDGYEFTRRFAGNGLLDSNVDPSTGITESETLGPGARHLRSLDAGIVAVPDEPTPEPTPEPSTEPTPESAPEPTPEPTVTPSAVPETPAAPSEQPSEQPVVPASGGGDHGGPDQVEVHSGEGAGLVGTSGWTPLVLGDGVLLLLAAAVFAVPHLRRSRGE